MKSEDENLVPVQILGIYPYGDSHDSQQLFETFLVFLKGQDDKVVPISIGRFEGQALAMALRKMPPPRPLPYNLLKDLLEKMHGEVRQLVIHTLKDEVFHAYLLIQAQGQAFYLDCRPSDGMTLATLTGVPIYMHLGIIDEAGRELGGLLEKTEAGEDTAVPERAVEPPGIELQQIEAESGKELNELEKLKALLGRLVQEEHYEEAARVRDQISKLEEQNA